MDPTPVPPNNTQKPTVLRATCLCGQVGWSSGAMPHYITICHCSECKKASGNPFLTFGLFHNSSLKWMSSTSGQSSSLPHGIKLIEFSDKAVRGFCSSCGTPLFMKYHCRPDGINVTMGIVDDEHTVGSLPPVKEHIFLKEKSIWWAVDDNDGLDKHQSFNVPFQKRLNHWMAVGRPKRTDIPSNFKPVAHL